MLILTRRNLETVKILCPDGKEVSVTIVRVEGGKVRIGFNAPREYKIFREELLNADHD